ncbi:efflux RND transporter periplasmic adaptor subunit [Mangrovimonas sp. TPBH4]|uniref:efflux RND transporter periplasmic adaptor subunit n=1 Tax=Mangrovimonas sp. TPBH4 TaxID=1645914 RepID=UPI0006B4FACD|nr:efflux RND transporter periplasmic adaptor subunit [Mangrovimonas sp. TPBH4]
MPNQNYSIVLLVLLLFGCKHEAEKPMVLVTSVDVIKLEAKTVPIYKDFVGQVFGIKDIPIRARVDGFLEGMHFEEGNRVEKGELLYSIDSQSFEAEVARVNSDVSAAKTLLAKSNSDYNRIKPLADLNAVSKSDLDGATARKEAADAELKAALASLEIANINLGHCKIYAPINGVIGKTLATEGEYVGKQPNPIILNTVSDIDTVRVQFFLSEAEYLTFMKRLIGTHQNTDEKFKTIADKQILELVLSDNSIHQYKGHLDFLDRNIDPSTGSILLQASFPNPDRLIRPGQFTKVRALVNQRENTILVPQKAVQEIQGQYMVFVVGNDGVVQIRNIEVFKNYKDYYIVEKGLEPGEQVIVDEVQKVKSKMKVAPKLVQYQSKVEN